MEDLIEQLASLVKDACFQHAFIAALLGLSFEQLDNTSRKGQFNLKHLLALMPLCLAL